jgi:hypothetical protein
MYLCQLFIEAPVPSQESEWSCIYVNLLLKHLYQARKVSSHVFMSTFYWSTCTKSGKWVVMYLCQLFIEAPVPSQESEWSCICVNFLLKHLYQARKVSGHVFVSTFDSFFNFFTGFWICFLTVWYFLFFIWFHIPFLLLLNTLQYQYVPK